MKLVVATLALAFAVSQTAAQYDVQSKPFYLQLVSKNKTIDGQYLTACHTGAAIESLCTYTGEAPGSVFTFNSSQKATPTQPGWVTWLLQGGNFNLSQPLGLYVDATSNVALPLFYPGTEITRDMYFDAENLLNIQGWIDDTKTPPVSGQGKSYYRWYHCTTVYSAYTYQTLAWVLGSGKPQNPSCVKVDVKRIWVKK